MLNEECPNSKGKNLKVFFTDAFELGEPYDKTTEAMTQLYTYAATIEDFKCDQTAAVVVGDWDKQFALIVKKFNNLYDKLDGDYKKTYQEKF